VLERLADVPKRDTVPINLPVPPALVDAAPTILAHYQNSASAKEELGELGHGRSDREGIACREVSGRCECW
jgi:hypothetical protein